MITTLRKNWFEIALICFCAVTVAYQTAVQKNHLYPFQFIACWLLLRLTLSGFANKLVPMKSCSRPHMLIAFAPLYALGMSTYFLKGHNFFDSYMSLIWFVLLRFELLDPSANRKTNWKLLHKLIAATAVFIVCFFALIIFQPQR